MAKTGRKTFQFDVQRIENIEDIINFAKSRADYSGLRIHVDYKHDKGLKISVAGPKDKINIFDHQLRDFVEELMEDEYIEIDLEDLY